MSATACPSELARSYVPRAPEETVWHRVLRDHLATFLESEKDPDDPGSGVPDFVERELRAVILCGSPALGFIRVACTDCPHEMLVPYSCHARAACPSCGARRMAEISARLVDRVIPDVPVRQWVVTAPWEIHGLLLADAALLTDFAGIAVSSIFRHLETKAAALGIQGGKGGSITFVQRGSSKLRPFPHLHIIALDGLYTKASEEAPPELHALTAPTPRDEDLVSADICRRVERLLHRRGFVDPDRPPATRLELWYARAADLRAQLATVDVDGRVKPGSAGQGRGPSTGAVAGFSVHARTAVPAGDKEGRERLLRYASRPPFANAQLSETADGRIAVELGAKRRAGETHVIIEPVALIRRIAWMIPPPKKHQAIYRGVLAPSARWRAEIVPLQIKTAAAPQRVTPPAGTDKMEVRSHGGRIAWAHLLARVFRIDALKCPKCGGRMRVIAALLDADVVRKILEHLDLPTELPSLAPPRWPP